MALRVLPEHTINIPTSTRNARRWRNGESYGCNQGDVASSGDRSFLCYRKAAWDLINRFSLPIRKPRKRGEPIMKPIDNLVLDIGGVMEMTTLSQSTIYALAKRGELPKQVGIAPNRVVWRRSEVIARLEKKMDAAAYTLPTPGVSGVGVCHCK